MAFWNRNKDEGNSKDSAIAELPMVKPKEKTRPKVNRKRSKTFGMCLTPEELQELNDGAQNAGMSRTDFIMACVRESNIIVMEGLPEILRELQYQGNNLNQLTRRINSRQHVSMEEIELTSYACMSAYTGLTRFVDQYEVRIKKLQEDKENANHHN